MTCSATDAPTISTTSLSNYFQNCSNFNGAIGNWNVSNITNFTQLFNNASTFNQNIGAWDTSNATTFSEMFSGAGSFNNGGSDTIKNWNTSSVITFFRMFRSCFNFNQPIGSWDTSSVGSMFAMFYTCYSFNQDISDWDISNVSNFTNFMGGLTDTNYDAAYLDNIYNKWSLLSVVSGLTIDFGTIKYTAAGQAGRDILTGAPNNWVINDGGI
jgi:surface protein